MMNNETSQPATGKMRIKRHSLSFPITSILGCLLVLVSFFFVNWNTSFYILFSSPYPFLNGPGVFQEMAHLYGTLAGIWLWIMPAAVAVALLLACAAWLWNARLLPLVSIPAALGLVLLTAFVLTGDQWDYYKGDGYWLAVLGLLMVLINGLWTRWNARENEALPAALAWHALMGGGLIFLSFFLPWLLLRTPFLPYHLNQLPPYQGAPITGMSLAGGSFAFLPPAYPRIAPQGYWLLWLVPLVGLLGAGTAWMSLRGQRISRWFWMLISLVPLLLYLFLLRPAVQGSVRSYNQGQGVQGNVTTYGWHLTLLGLTLLFFSGLLWKEEKREKQPVQEQQRKGRVRRRLLGGIAGLITVAYGGYLFWQTNKMYRATLTLPLPTGERYGYGAVAWAADGRRFAATNTNAFWLWDAVAMKQIRTVKYPSFVEHNTDFTELAWSPDQRFIATLVGGSAQVYEIAAGKWVSHWIAAGDPSPHQGIAWSADSQYVATTFTNGTLENNGNGVEIHDAITSKLVRSFTFAPSSTDQGSREYVTVSWSPDNRWLAAGGQIQKYNVDQVFATIWDVSSGAQVFSTSYIPGSTSTNNFQLYVTVAWSPDGKRLAVASDTTGVKLWDVASKKLLRTYSGSGGTFGEGLSWSPDSRYIAACEGSVVRIWDTTNGQTLFSYWGHQQDTIRGLSWSSRGNAIASSSLGSIRVWQPEI